MKRRGSVFEYKMQRDADLLRTYRSLASTYSFTSMSDLFKCLVEMPSARFWVSEERAAIVIASMMRGDKLSALRPTKRDMFREIYRRCAEMLSKDRTVPLSKVVSIVVRQPAPKFYMTTGTAKVLFYRIRNNWMRNARKGKP